MTIRISTIGPLAAVFAVAATLTLGACSDDGLGFGQGEEDRRLQPAHARSGADGRRPAVQARQEREHGGR